MKIGFRAIKPFSNRGKLSYEGLGVYAKNIAEGLSHTPHEIVPIPFTYWPKNGQYLEPVWSAVTPGLISLYSDIEKKIDIFHSTDHHIPRMDKIPVVATIHDAFCLSHPDWAPPNFREIKNYLLVKMAKHADHYIVPTSWAKESVSTYWKVEESKISVVHNGLPNSWFTKMPAQAIQEILAKFNLNPGFILNVGTLQPRKNIVRLIEAFLMLPEELRLKHPLVICGKAGWCMDEILPKLHALLETKTGRWLQSINEVDLQALYQASAFTAYPSLGEGFGNPIAESFAAGKPVITSNFGAMAEVAGNAGYLIDPIDSAQLSHAMFSLITDAKLTESYKLLARERANQYTEQRFISDILSVYESLLS